MWDDPKGNKVESVANGLKTGAEVFFVFFFKFHLFALLQFVNNMMLYQNEISLPEDEGMSQKILGEEPEYE